MVWARVIQPYPSQCSWHKSPRQSPGSRVRKPPVRIATQSWKQGIIRRSPLRSPGGRRRPQNTATRPMWRAWSWRATAWAVRSGIRRGFWTARPRLPKCRERRADEAGLLEPAGTRTTTRRMGQQREAEAMGWMARNTGSQRPTAAAGQGRRRRLRQPLRAPRWMGQCWCGARPCHAPPRSADSRLRGGGVHGVPAPLSAR